MKRLTDVLDPPPSGEMKAGRLGPQPGGIVTQSGVPRLLLDIMQCPACGGSLVEGSQPPSLTCSACGLRYPVNDGIPVMLVDEAEPTGPDGP